MMHVYICEGCEQLGEAPCILLFYKAGEVEGTPMPGFDDRVDWRRMGVR